MRILLAVGLLLALAAPARAQDEPLLSLPMITEACASASEGTHDRLFSVVVDGGWRFGDAEHELGEDGSVVSSVLPIDTRRNLRALRGRVEVMPSRLEGIGFIASESRVAELEAARATGAALRVGFFLGFDEPARSACLVRGAHGVTTIRMDVAFVELVRPDGSVVAREDTDRFASWSDDHERDAIAGAGPRAQVGSATLPSGARAPDAWQAALAGGELTTALSACHRAGVERGAAGDAIARVRIGVDARSGRVASARVELSNLGDAAENECIEAALSAASLPAGPPELPGRVELGATVRFAD